MDEDSRREGEEVEWPVGLSQGDVIRREETKWKLGGGSGMPEHDCCGMEGRGDAVQLRWNAPNHHGLFALRTLLFNSTAR